MGNATLPASRPHGSGCDLQLAQRGNWLVLPPLADSGIGDVEQAGQFGVVFGPEQFAGEALGDGLFHPPILKHASAKVKRRSSDGRSAVKSFAESRVIRPAAQCAMPHKSLSARLLEAMKDAQIPSGAHLARLCDVSDVTIGNWLNDKVQPDQVKAALLLRIAKVLRIRPEWLLWGEGPKLATAGIPAPMAASSQPVKSALLTSALQIVGEAVSKHSLPATPAEQAELVSLAYDLLDEGVPEAKVLRFVLAAA